MQSSFFCCGYLFQVYWDLGNLKSLISNKSLYSIIFALYTIWYILQDEKTFTIFLFSNGTVKNTISLEKQLNIIQVADLVLPDVEASFEEYTTIELLSVAMLIVISTFALDFIHSDHSVFKIVVLDEA